MMLFVDDAEDFSMNVEEGPKKTLYELVGEWIDYYKGNRESPHMVSMLVDEKDTTTPSKKRVNDLRYLDRVEKRRRTENTEEERNRVLTMLARKGIDYIGNETQLERMFEFRDILLKPDGSTTMRGRVIRQNDAYSQDPYDIVGRTWRTPDQLRVLNTPRVIYTPNSKTGIQESDFDELYDEAGYKNVELQTYSRPGVQLLNITEPNREKFKAILYGDTQVLMKIIPFVNERGQLKSPDDIKEIYNEIKIAYFLAELLYGYTNVLSVHFMVMVDWIQASRSKLGLFANPDYPTTMDTLTSQITISEYAHTTVGEFFTDFPSFKALRLMIFQVMHALETAWHTNEFVHYDLHTSNVMFKKTDYADSPFKGRSLLYKRRHVAQWYVLPKEDLGNHIVKIIDFGFSRIYAPSVEQHLLYSVSAAKPPHVHDRFIGLDWPENDVYPDRPNRYVDVRLFMLSMFYLPNIFWTSITKEEKATLHALLEQVLDFKEINLLIDALGFRNEVHTIRRYNAGGVLTPENIASCRPCLDFLTKFGGYARSLSNARNEWTATDLLNHSFFDELKREPQQDATAEYQRVALQEEVVVSFIDDETLQETQMLKDRPENPFQITTRQLSCSVCKAGNVNHYNVEGKTKVPLCSALCAEFKYIYNEKTVFR